MSANQGTDDNPGAGDATARSSTRDAHGGAAPLLGPAPSPPPLRMLQKMFVPGFMEAGCIFAAARLGLADAVGDGCVSSEDLAEASGGSAAKLQRLMRFLIGRGVFARAADGPAGEPRFENNALSATLRSDAADSVAATAMHLEDVFQSWSQFTESLREEGRSAWDLYYRQELFGYYTAHPSKLEMFQKALAGTVAMRLAALSVLDPAVAAAPGDDIVDVGGGNGALLAAALQMRPLATGAVYELPDVAQQASALLQERGLSAERARVIAGDFFTGKNLPEGSTVYLMASVLHDWPDEAAAAILRNVAKVMGPQSLLVVMDFVLPEEYEPGFATTMDINMLATVGGRERTEAQFAALLKRAGLKLSRVQADIPDVQALIYARKC